MKLIVGIDGMELVYLGLQLQAAVCHGEGAVAS